MALASGGRGVAVEVIAGFPLGAKAPSCPRESTLKGAEDDTCRGLQFDERAASLAATVTLGAPAATAETSPPARTTS